MSGLVAMACGETARFSEPYDSLMSLHTPTGWEYRSARSISVAENWNDLGRYFLGSSHEWLFLVNDDHVYPPDTLLRLLAHNKDAVTALYLSRQLPFAPILYDRVNTDGTVHPRYLRNGERGLVRVDACGDGALLLHRRVLEAIPQPWWALGVNRPDACDHDVVFSQKISQAGCDLWCDLDVSIQHLGLMSVGTIQHQGIWQTILIVGPRPQDAIALPTAQSPLAV